MIRKMTESDKSIYFEMSRQFYASGAALKQISDEYREKFWNVIKEGVSVNAYIIQFDGKVAGYALTVPYASQEFGGYVLWIDELFILPEFRGHGLGRDFLKYIEKEFSKGTVLLRLEAEPDNLKAIKLYERLGYKKLPYLQMIKTKD